MHKVFDVVVVQFDLHAGAKLAAGIVQTAQSLESALGCHTARFVGKIDRDVIPRGWFAGGNTPAISTRDAGGAACDEAAARLTRRHPHDAVVLPPELVLVESAPYRIFLDVQHEFCSVLLNCTRSCSTIEGML